MQITAPPLHQKKAKTIPAWFFIFLTSFSAFTIYTCTYAFRKPFTASSFDGIVFWGMSYKVLLVISQVLGYMAGKFYGIRFIATIKAERRSGMIVKLVLIAWAALLLFALIPAPYNLVCMILNGFPLAMIWGLIFSYLEGRKITEILGAVLATSLIFASGLAKTIGKWLLVDIHISHYWMPFCAGSLFLIPLFFCTWLLNKTPPPTAADIQQRTLRKPMNAAERKSFLKVFGMALIPIIISYAMLTILRDFSEDFSNELWVQAGYGKNPDIFAETSTLIAVIVMVVIAGFFLIKNSYRAFQLNHRVIIVGFLVTIIATFLYYHNTIGVVPWMVCATSGLYIGYVPFNCFYFERMLAAFKVQGNVGFVMYISDAFGYLGTVLVLIIKEMVHIQYSWISFFGFLFYVASAVGIVLVVASSIMFKKIYCQQRLCDEKEALSSFSPTLAKQPELNILSAAAPVNTL